MAKKKKQSRRALITKLDKVFSVYIRRRHGDIAQCVTCGAKAHWKKMQAGHFMSRRHISTRWNPVNVQVQCPKCNIWEQGQQYEYSKFLGSEQSEEMLRLSREIVRFSDDELVAMIEEYSKLVDDIEKNRK